MKPCGCSYRCMSCDAATVKTTYCPLHESAEEMRNSIQSFLCKLGTQCDITAELETLNIALAKASQPVKESK